MKKTAIILTILITTSCVTLVDKIDLTSFQNTDNMESNGYYFHLSGIPSYEQDSISKVKKIKTIYSNVTPIVFYQNGLVYFKRRGVTEIEKYNNEEPFKSFPHHELNKFWTNQMKEPCKSKRNLVGWGNYFTKGDSLVINYYDYKFQHPGWTSNKLILISMKGKILNDSTLELYMNEYLTKTFYFVESKNIPDAKNCRIKIK